MRLSCKFIALVLATLCAAACTQFERLQSETKEKRIFKAEKKWVRQTTLEDQLKFRKINRFKPVLYKDLVIQGNSIDGLVAYTQQGGQSRWRLAIPNGVESSAALINNRLFFGAMDGQFYSVNADNGMVIWTFPTRIETLAEPLLVDGVVYFLTGNNSLFALDAATGKQSWIYSRQESSTLSIRGGSKPAYKNGSLIVGFSDGALVSLLAETGTVKWERQLSRNKRFKDLDSDIVIDKDFIYVLGFDDSVYCLNVNTGEEIWRYRTGGYGRPYVSQDMVYFASTNNEMIALNKESGREVWKINLTKSSIASSPEFYKGTIAFGESNGMLRFVDALSGNSIAHFEPGRGVFAQPAIDAEANRAYFVSNEANLWALEIGWSRPNWIPFIP